jgi:hypothetical protein
MLMRTVAAAFALSLIAVAAPGHARADDLCKPGHIIDIGRNVCYDPATSYRPNVPAQQSILGSGSSAEAKPQSAPGQTPQPAAASESSGGMFGWLKEQARFCRFGDRQYGSGDAAYCVDRAGKSYPAGK